MADNRTFTLIGQFDDKITSHLNSINSTLNTLKKNLNSFGAKRGGFDDLNKSIGKTVTAHKVLNTEVKNLRASFLSSISVMRQYRSELGKLAGAKIGLKKSSSGVNTEAAYWRNANAAAARYRSTLMRLPRNASPQAPNRGGGRPGGGYGGDGGGGGGGRRGGGGGGYASAVFGNQLGNMITGSIVRGFELGVNLIQKPFQAFGSALAERISDEMSDLQAAGGIFAISKRRAAEGKDPFVQDFDKAIAFQQKMNLSMAKMANSLPGSTQDYVNVQKRLTDTMARIAAGDIKGATAVSNKIRATEEGKRYYGGQLSTDDTTKAGQAELIRDNINTMSGELTKLTVLAGLTGGTGGGGGVRGPMGPYGLPGLSERMLSEDSVSMSGMQRYAAIFRDPAIREALERHIPKLNAELKGTPARFNALINMFKEIVTPELVAKLRRSVAGINESLRSTFFSPEAGFLGLGRKLKDMGPMFNDFGQAVDENGKAVKGMTEAAKANLSIFEMLRDIYANTMLALMPIVEGLGSIFDPLQAIGNTLKGLRIASAKFLKNFYFYRNSLEDYANKLGGLSGKQLLEDLDLRAALQNINNLFRGFKIFNEKDFTDTTNLLLNPSSNPAELIGTMIKKFFSSEAATALGEQIGTTIGTVFKELSNLMSSIGDGLGTNIAPGFAKGFQEAGGFAAIQNIFVQLLKMFFSAFATVIKEMPLLALVGTGLALAPALIGAGSTALVEGLISRGRGRGGRGGGGGGGGGGGYAGGFLGEQRGTRALRLRSMRRMRDASRGIPGIAGAAQGIGGLAKGVGNVGRFVPGGAIAGGVMDFALAKATGQSTGKAFAGAAGSIIGATVGSALGPIGTVAGGVLGSLAGNAIYDAFSPAGKAQQSAALLQKEAADRQLEAASKSDLTSKYGIPDLNYSYGQSADLGDRLKMLGVSSHYTVQAFQKEYFERNNAAQILKDQNAKLEEAQKTLTALKLPPDALSKKLAPLEKSAAEAAARLKIEQGQLSDAVAKMPTKIQDAIIDNVQKVSMQGVADALALKVAGMSVLPPPERNLFAVPNNNPFKVNTPPPPNKTGLPDWLVKAKGSPGKKFGNLGGAISYEMANKPSGSNLVIANSSETVIPAAGGLGMEGLVQAIFGAAQRTASTITQGFTTLTQTTAQGDQSIVSAQKQTALQTQQTILKSTQEQLAAIKASGGGGMPGGLGSASVGGGVDAFTGMAASAGLQLTSGYRPGDPGWHGANRARDYSNGTGPTPQMLQFARALAAKYGSSLKELIYTPLGFSIKNGQQVAPYAQAAHNNHVHVAYALGAGNPAFFNSQSSAQQWEKTMAPSSAKVRSFTANSSEGLGGTINGGINVTVHAGSVSDPNQLAAIVVAKMSEWVSDARTSSIFV